MTLKTKRAGLLAELSAEMSTANIIEPLNNSVEIAENRKQKRLSIPFYLQSKKLHTALKQLALDEDSNINKLLFEGLELVFHKRGKSIQDYL
jgi:hypothetical protein